jgi:8-hydroxy-5-deazaflavin:NADPH oxidoreductase
MTEKHTIAVLGGTGQEGGSLGLRWAKAGHRVIVGSRSAEKAATAANEMNLMVGQGNVSAATNKDAAAAADIIVLTVPHAAQRSTVEEVRETLIGKILIDATVPLPSEGRARAVAR